MCWELESPQNIKTKVGDQLHIFGTPLVQEAIGASLIKEFSWLEIHKKVR